MKKKNEGFLQLKVLDFRKNFVKQNYKFSLMIECGKQTNEQNFVCRMSSPFRFSKIKRRKNEKIISATNYLLLHGIQ